MISVKVRRLPHDPPDPVRQKHFFSFPSFRTGRVLCVTNATLFDSGLCVPAFLFTAVKILHSDFYGYSASWSIIFCPDSWTSSVSPREAQAIGFILIRYSLPLPYGRSPFLQKWELSSIWLFTGYIPSIFNGSTEEAGRLSFWDLRVPSTRTFIAVVAATIYAVGPILFLLPQI